MVAFRQTLIDGDPDRYEQRYSVTLGSVQMHMVRRPVAIVPPEGTICFVDNGPRVGPVPRSDGGAFKGGRWVGVKFEPTHWTHWQNLDGTDAG